MDENVQIIVEAHVRRPTSHLFSIDQPVTQFEKMLKESGLAPIMTAINNPGGEVRWSLIRHEALMLMFDLFSDAPRSGAGLFISKCFCRSSSIRFLLVVPRRTDVS